METQVNVHWSTTVKIITIVVSILILIVIRKLYNRLMINSSNYILWCVIFIIVSICGFFILNAPVSIVLQEDKLILKKILGNNTIRYTDISDIERYNLRTTDIRLLGSGGFFGFVGIFYSNNLGRYLSYVGDTGQAFLIKVKNGKKYVFSCEDPDLVIKKVKEKTFK